MKEKKPAATGPGVWEVVCDPYPRIIVEAHDEEVAKQKYRDHFGLKRPELPVRAKLADELVCR